MRLVHADMRMTQRDGFEKIYQQPYLETNKPGDKILQQQPSFDNELYLSAISLPLIKKINLTRDLKRFLTGKKDTK